MLAETPKWAQETADEWAAGFAPAAGARLVKFMRAEADADTMFDPLSWPLPAPGMIWQFCVVLDRSLVIHAATFVAVPQYFFMPAADGFAAPAITGGLLPQCGRADLGQVWMQINTI
ncbi:hypothetical protein [Cupriavidus basilensis]|uniref:hypothetical protein n=1 Tax=Cupriavidus basilensis TaxID=68895 RepID=UPI0028500D70|nr:hypothetical protein [Cupriavidus basilensis]MDR3381220.1 hypothetical protein [Cupriavidus basilensis]